MDVTTTFAKATEAATVGEMTPRLAMECRVFSRVRGRYRTLCAQCDGNVDQLLCLGNALIPKGKEEVELSTSNVVNMLKSIQVEIGVDVSVTVQNIRRDCFRIT